MNWFLDVVKNKYAKFDGRAGRPEFWFFALFYFLIAIVVGLIEAVIGISPLLFLLLSLAFLLPSLAVTVRRFHDQDRSGWFVLLGFIPFVGGIILIIFMVLPGTPGDNRFGPPAPTSPGA
ncbi:MAG: DUF805 domain-containing protein [Burkholderiales bacterium]|jgi:uncharacterized membrane protein YhaH (DUF805 family)|nr:DUF805 domain-containing protein [Burkholderiales bacterium]